MGLEASDVYHMTSCEERQLCEGLNQIITRLTANPDTTEKAAIKVDFSLLLGRFGAEEEYPLEAQQSLAQIRGLLRQ